MGTTLTGTTPQDTYESLIKVADNGPLSGTAKFLSDGEGLDSALALSTTAVGIGTASPTANLEVSRATQQTDFGAASQVIALLNTSADIANNATGIRFRQVNGTNNCNAFVGTLSSGSSTNRSSLVFAPSNSGGDAAEQMRITSAGNVGIGTSAPAAKLHVAGENIIVDRTGGDPYIDFFTGGVANNVALYGGATTGLRAFIGGSERARFTANGLTFNGDTAAANALDDYEEGTWTMGVAFGGASVDVTTSSNTGTYTKVGRQVTVNGYLALSNKGSSTGDAQLTGLPFTIPNVNQSFATASLWFANVTFANQFQGYGLIGSTTVNLREITILGVDSALTDADFGNNSQIIVSLTYFV